MKKATIPYCDALDFKSYVRLPVDTFLWEKNGYEPKTAAYICYNKEGVAFRLISFETPTITVAKDEGPVWTDSCLEVFLRPFSDDDRYLNFECNADGAMIIGLGSGREGRVSVLSKIKPEINLSVLKEPGKWQVSFALPFSLLCRIFGKASFHLPGEADVNFYKCGDNTPFPHYGMWNEIQNDFPDFHRKEDFGRMIFF